MFLSKAFLLCFVAAELVAGRCHGAHPKHKSHRLKSSVSNNTMSIKHQQASKVAAVSASAPASFVSVQPTQSIVSVAPTTTQQQQPAQTSSSSGSSPAGEKFIGLGTRYGGSCTEEDCWQNGACSFVGYDLPAGIDGSTCVSSDIWQNGANCGGCISVTYKGKTITVMVTNETGGNATHLDMTPATWSKLTNGYSGGGVDGIEWEWVTCPIAESTPLWIKMHGGASKYWFAATVENARERTAMLEVSSDEGSTWKSTVLDNYNMWTLGSVLPSDSAWVRVTSLSGSKVVVKNVQLASGVITKADGNYA